MELLGTKSSSSIENVLFIIQPQAELLTYPRGILFRGIRCENRTDAGVVSMIFDYIYRGLRPTREHSTILSLPITGINLFSLLSSIYRLGETICRSVSRNHYFVLDSASMTIIVSRLCAIVL